jgi:nitrogen fixation NifU-like protein
MNETFSDKIYKEHIMELYKSPKNYGILENITHEHTETNSSCGDEITIQLLVKDGRIRDIKFSGSGCVMSLVSSSLLTDKIKNMNLEDAKKITKKDILELLKVKINPSRMKCVLLPLEALRRV